MNTEIQFKDISIGSWFVFSKNCVLYDASASGVYEKTNPPFMSTNCKRITGTGGEQFIAWSTDLVYLVEEDSIIE